MLTGNIRRIAHITIGGSELSHGFRLCGTRDTTKLDHQHYMDFPRANLWLLYTPVKLK
jgi:hypothetical protein